MHINEHVLDLCLAVLVKSNTAIHEKKKITGLVSKVICSHKHIERDVDLYKRINETIKSSSTQNPNAATLKNRISEIISYLELSSVVDYENFILSTPIPSNLLTGVLELKENLGISIESKLRNAPGNTYPIRIDPNWKTKLITGAGFESSSPVLGISNYHLYQSYRAAYDWDRVSGSKEYLLNIYCKDLLRAYVQSDDFKFIAKQINQFIELGTGSNEKTSLILDQLNNFKLNNKEYIFIDASVPMLEHNMQHFISNKKYEKIKFKALSFDFEEPKKMLDMRTEYGASIIKTEAKAYFINGYTVFNLNDRKFFKSYYSVMSSGDILVATLNFIPEYLRTDNFMINEKNLYTDELVAAYSSKDAQNMLKNSLIEMKGYESSELKVEPHARKSSNRTDVINKWYEIICTAAVKQSNGNVIDDFQLLTVKRYFKIQYDLFLKDIGFKIKDFKHPEDDNTFLYILYK